MSAIKYAVAIAREFIESMYPDAKSLRLEGVEPIDDYWEIIFSFLGDEKMTGSAAFLMGKIVPDDLRTYKKVTVAGSEAKSLRPWKP